MNGPLHGVATKAASSPVAKAPCGDPARDDVRMGPLVGLKQRSDVLAHVAKLRGEAELVAGDPDRFDVLMLADPQPSSLAELDYFRDSFFELLADVFTVECLFVCHPGHVERRGRNDEFTAVHHHVGIVLQRPIKTDSLPVTSFLGLFHSASLSGFPPRWKPFTCNFGLS